METAIVKKNGIAMMVSVLKKGGIIIFPTETSYGIGADALDRKAILKVHNVKKQPTDKPISIIVPDIKTAEKFGEMGATAKKLVKKFMPGPFTLIVKKQKTVPNILSRKTMAFRISSDKTADSIARKFGSAITATSANIHGEQPIYSFRKAVEVFGGRVDLIVDAGNLRKRRASTIYDLARGKVLRNGPISGKEIERIVAGK